MSRPASGLYEGTLAHSRRVPRPHGFCYRVAMLYLDLDELPSLLAASPYWREGRFGLLSFCRRDYLGDPGQPLKEAVLDLARRRLGSRPTGPVRLLTHVRCLGYVFNPVSFYYCFAQDGVTLQAVVAEITNTPWGERHAYVLPAGPTGVDTSFDKTFHVSPFFSMNQRYTWELTTPGDRLGVVMVNEEQGRRVFRAELSLRRRDLELTRVWPALLRQSFMGWKVHLAIYWQAWRLWRKRTPFHAHPPAPARAGGER